MTGPWNVPIWLVVLLLLIAAVFLALWLITEDRTWANIYIGVACGITAYDLHLIIERRKALKR